MTVYNVHIFREMRLKFDGIEADTPEAAAAIADDKLADQADEIEDSDGVGFSAVVDLVGDGEDTFCRAIYFEAGRLLNAATTLLATLESVAALRRKWRSQDEAETIDSIVCNPVKHSVQANYGACPCSLASRNPVDQSTAGNGTWRPVALPLDSGPQLVSDKGD
jgi:hypothetical protein